MTGPKKVGNEIIEGSFHSHQVPLPAAAADDEQLALLNQWLSSYKPHELFHKDGSPVDVVLDIIPKDNEKRMGQRKETYAAYTPLSVTDWKAFAVERGSEASCMTTIGGLLDKILVDNPTTARIFSPDELESNKLNAVFKHTNRNFQWDPATHAKGGRVIEILSEHTCQGLLQGICPSFRLIQDIL
jgi:xylulose-5-phosphate/fructose-6-phosphate phosphoketolase